MSAALKGLPGGAPQLFNAPSQNTRILFLQSYLDASGQALTPLPGQALLDSPPNQSFVQSTVKEEQEEGRAIGLAPWSETPIAVEIKTQNGGYSAGLTLRPGEFLPVPSGFKGYRWGLPFGWLGGGLATIMAYKDLKNLPNWATDRREILFHRLRVAVSEEQDQPPSTPVNWPLRFPWIMAFKGTPVGGSFVSAIGQSGKSNLSVEPTRTLMRLRGNVALGAFAPVRVVWWSTEAFDANEAMIIPAPAASTTYYWQSSFPANIDGIFITPHNPAIEIDPTFARVGADATPDGQKAFGITIEVPFASPLLTGGPAGGPCEIDILRYGKI